MKIRTFIICEDIDIDPANSNNITIKSMMAGLYAHSVPAKEKLVVLLTFDEIENKEKELQVTLRNSKNKVILRSVYDLEPQINAAALELEVEFPDYDNYTLRFDYNNEFLGKYPFFIKERTDNYEE